jgi:hypothetical protein
MTTGWARKGWWVVADIAILIYALAPALWIISLSFKPLHSINEAYAKAVENVGGFGVS